MAVATTASVVTPVAVSIVLRSSGSTANVSGGGKGNLGIHALSICPMLAAAGAPQGHLFGKVQSDKGSQSLVQIANVLLNIRLSVHFSDTHFL